MCNFAGLPICLWNHLLIFLQYSLARVLQYLITNELIPGIQIAQTKDPIWDKDKIQQRHSKIVDYLMQIL